MLNQKTILFPDVRSVVLGYYTELDEDETDTLKEYTCIVTLVNVNDHDRTILNSYHKSYRKQATSLKDCWGVYESNCGNNDPAVKPVLIPVFLANDIAYEFVCYFSLIDKLAQQKANLHTVELVQQSVVALKNVDILPTLLAAEKPRISHEMYLHYRAADLRPISELVKC